MNENVSNNLYQKVGEYANCTSYFGYIKWSALFQQHFVGSENLIDNLQNIMFKSSNGMDFDVTMTFSYPINMLKRNAP